MRKAGKASDWMAAGRNGRLLALGRPYEPDCHIDAMRFGGKKVSGKHALAKFVPSVNAGDSQTIRIDLGIPFSYPRLSGVKSVVRTRGPEPLLGEGCLRINEPSPLPSGAEGLLLTLGFADLISKLTSDLEDVISAIPASKRAIISDTLSALKAAADLRRPATMEEIRANHDLRKREWEVSTQAREEIDAEIDEGEDGDADLERRIREAQSRGRL